MSNERKDIMALGSSRVLQFRSNMFSTSFYNAGYAITSLSDYKPFIKSLPKNKYPKVLIIGLDQWMFNKDWDKTIKRKDSTHWSSSYTFIPESNILVNTFSDWISGKISFYPINSNDEIVRIGMNANVNNKGFRNDGSMYYGTQIKKLLENDKEANDFGFNDTYKRINDGNRRMQHGEKINQNAINEISVFLQLCFKNNIKVVGFLPPFAKQIKNKMKYSNNYLYLEKIMVNCMKEFDKYDFELYDLSDITQFGVIDSNFIDGIHGSEITYLNMLIYMLENGSILNNYSNITQLKKDALNPINRYLVYP